VKLNKRGATLIETLIAVSILTVLISSVAYLFTTFNRQSAQLEKLKDVNLAITKIRTLLSQREACSRTFRRSAFPAANPVDGPVNFILSDQGAVLPAPTFGVVAYQVGTEIAPNVQIQSMRTANLAIMPVGDLLPGDRAMQFLITFRITGDVFPGLNYDTERTIPIYMTYNAGNFVECVTTGHIGTDQEYLSNFQDDVIPNLTHFVGDTTPLLAPFNGFNFILGIQGQLRIFPSAALPALTGYVSAQNFDVMSDENKKKNIETISKPLDHLKLLNGYTYVLRDTHRPDLGLLSRDLKDHTPLVKVLEDGTEAVNYNGVVGLQIEATKALYQEQVELRKRLKK
jgi:type II secretory pathway pseudopilin PulG